MPPIPAPTLLQQASTCIAFQQGIGSARAVVHAAQAGDD